MSFPLIFKQITLRNFLSYGNIVTTIDLTSSGTTLINGVDLDNIANGAVANGVGKTSVFNALVYALYDEAISNISKDKLINHINNKNMMVTCTFTKNNKEYKIERARKTKSGNYVKLFEDDVEITRDSVANTNKLIENIIGMPYSIFVVAVVFTAMKTPFLDLTSAEQTAIVEHLNGLTEISERAEVLKELMKETQAELKQEEFKIEFIKKEHVRQQTLSSQAQDRFDKWNTDQLTLIQSLKDERVTLSKINFDDELKHHKTISTIQQNIKIAESEERQKQLDCKKFEKNILTLEDELKHLTNHECPYCGQHYNDVQEKIKDKKAELNILQTTVASLKDELSVYGSFLADERIELSSVKKLVSTSSVDEVTKLQIKVGQMDQKIQSAIEAENPFIQSLQDLKDVKLDDVEYEKINAINKTIEHQKFLLKILTKKDSFVRKVLLDKNLPFLNKKLQQHLSDLGLQHKVEFTTELTTEISIHGKALDFGNLSNGQRSRVNIALAMAFRDLLQKLHSPINICLYDEVLDVGLDGMGVQLAAKLIKKRAKEEKSIVYVISHREEVEGIFDKVMTVEFQNRFSTIKESS